MYLDGGVDRDRLGTGSGVDALGMDRPSIAWEYLEVPTVPSSACWYLELLNANTQAVLGCLEESRLE